MMTTPIVSSRSLAAFSVDVEDYFQVEALRPHCPRSQWESLPDRTEMNVDRILMILDTLGHQATFFILGWNAQRHPGMVKRIAEAGHEIASHGYDHELIYNQVPDVFREDVRRARHLLQDQSGQEVIGYRAPSYTLMTRTQWAIPILAEEGHRYDSSIFPIPRRRYGMPGANRWPHRMPAGRNATLVEFPLPTVRIGLTNIPATGGAYLRLLPLRFQQWAVGRLLRAGRPFVVTIHPWELDASQPRLPVSLRTRWTHYHNLSRTEARLTSLLSLAPYRSISAVLQEVGLL